MSARHKSGLARKATMANGKETTETQKKIQDFMKKNPGKKVGDATVHGTVAEPVKPNGEAKDTAVAAEAKPAEPERVIEDKTFDSIDYSQGAIECHLIAMNMVDVHDYIGYAKELYDVVEESDSDNLVKIDGKRYDASTMFQRDVNKARRKEISAYLTRADSMHFFPALVCVAVADKCSVDENGMLVISESGIVAIDGQHRKSGIDAALATMGIDSDFAKEQIPVIVITSPLTLDERQQIFADINRTPKTVSKALSILFDHRDEFAIVTNEVAKELGDVVDLTRTSPTSGSSNVCSLSNIYNLVVNFATLEKKPRNKQPMRENVDHALAKAVALEVFKNYPSHDRLVAGTDTYGAVHSSYICYWSTLYQAIGNAASHVSKRLDPEAVAETIGRLVKSTNWDISNPAWKKFVHENAAGKHVVGTRTDDVTQASDAVETIWNDLLSGQQQ